MEIIEIIKEIYGETYEFLALILQPLHDFLIKYHLDNPMLRIVLAFVPALIGIAYPLIIQTIGRLNDQYNSTHIIKQFKNEFLHKAFILNLRISVGLTILCFIIYIPIFAFAFVSVVSLLILFFLYLNLLLSYLNGQALFEIYSKKFTFDSYFKDIDKIEHPEKIKSKILKYWHPIIDLYIYSIKNKDKKLEYDIWHLFINPTLGFIRYIDQKDQDYVLYPTEIYNSSFEIVLEYLSQNETNYYQNIEAFIGTMFFLENYGKTKNQYIHQETYYSIWRNIVATIENNRTDKIKLFWRRAHQYCDFHIKVPYPDYDENYKEKKESIELRKNIEFNRNSFIQFNTVMGAYLYHKKECKSIKEIWNFTQSQPPRYVLIPQSVQSILDLFFIFNDNGFQHVDIIIRYWFKDLEFDAMNNKLDVRYVVCEYLCLLFLRLYITTGFYGSHPISVIPTIPEEQQEKRNWEEQLNLFKRILEKLLNNDELIRCLGLEKITRENCEKDGLDYPTNYIDNFITKIQDGFRTTLEESPLSEEKVASLNNNTVSAIKKVYNNVSRVKGLNEISKDNCDYLSAKHMEVVRGTRILLNREAFIENTSIHHLNADLITGEIIQQEYYHHFATKISLQKKKRKYSVSTGELFKAIELLGLTAKDYSIICFGINIKYHKDYMGVMLEESTGQEDYVFNEMPVFSYNVNFSSVYGSIYIIKNSDLPMIKHGNWSDISDLPEKTQERWSNMNLIDDELKIYSEIKELNTDEELREEYKENGKSEEELKNQIEYDVDFLGYIWFRKDVEIIEIKESDKFQEGGDNTDITKIKPIE